MLGWQAVRFSLRATGNNAPGDLSEAGVSGTFIGAALPLPFGGVLEDRLTLGIGAFTPNDLIARARLLYPERPQFPLITDRAQTLNFNMGLGVDLGHGITVGGGALALAELVGTVVVRTDSSGRVGTTVDDQLVATYAPIAGVAAELGDTRLGLTWRGALEGDFDVVVQVFDLGSLTVPDLNISGVAQYDPMQLQAEVAQRFGPLTAVAGATWEHWSAFEGWRKATVQCPPSQPDCDALVPEPVKFHDVVVPRVGALFAFALSDSARAEARAGYAFAKSPLDAQKGPANYFDNDRHVLSVGYGVELAEPLPPITLDAFYQLQLLAPRTHEKDASVAADNPGAPTVKSSGTVQNAGVFLGVKF
jgi:long-chain fatty acid transport protein